MEQLCLLVLVAVVVGCSASSSSTTKPASASSSTTTAVTSSRSSEAVVSLESDLAAAQVPNFINPVECRELVNLLYKHNRTHDEICRAVLETDGCQSSDAYINYVNFLYCLLPGLQWYWLTLGGVLYTLWIAVMFVVVGVIADEFFCAALEVLSEMLHMSESIAGVTLLAFGTGAPEVFSSIAAVNSAETAQPTLALGSLMGSGLLATTIIAGSLFSATPFTLAKRPFMRDILFYMGTIIWIIVILWKGSISQLEGIGFLILYLSYANIVIFGRVIWLKCWVKRRSRCRPVDGVKGNDGGNDINCDPVVDDAELRERDADERRVVSEIMSPPSRPSLLRRAESIRVKNCEKFKVNLELAEIGPHHHQYHHSGSMQDACKASAEHWDKSSSRRPSLSYGDLSSWRRQDDKKTTVPFSPAAGGTGEKSNHLKPPSPLPDVRMEDGKKLAKKLAKK